MLQTDPTVLARQSQLADEFLAKLRAAHNPIRAEREAQYLKSTRPFIGVDVPTIRKITKSLVCSAPIPAPEESIGAAMLLWQLPEYEARRVACEILCAVAKRRELDLSALSWLEPMIADGETWAIVDVLCVGVTGVILDVDRSPSGDAVLRAWSQSPQMWVRRASVLSMLPSLRRDLDRWPLFVELADSLMSEREFFIRKVIGWVARDVSRRWPEVVTEWAIPRLDDMSGVTRREVQRHLRF